MFKLTCLVTHEALCFISDSEIPVLVGMIGPLKSGSFSEAITLQCFTLPFSGHLVIRKLDSNKKTVFVSRELCKKLSFLKIFFGKIDCIIQAIPLVRHPYRPRMSALIGSYLVISYLTWKFWQ